MIIGSISENRELEKRISITPDLVKKYISNGFDVLIEEGFGSHIGISDEKFIKEGCKIDKKGNILKKSEIILQLNLPEENNIEFFKAVQGGDLVSCYGYVTDTGTTSVTVHIDVMVGKTKVACGDFINVALDDKGKPRKIK